jgi:hypothetical protein
MILLRRKRQRQNLLIQFFVEFPRRGLTCNARTGHEFSAIKKKYKAKDFIGWNDNIQHASEARWPNYTYK